MENVSFFSLKKKKDRVPLVEDTDKKILGGRVPAHRGEKVSFLSCRPLIYIGSHASGPEVDNKYQ